MWPLTDPDGASSTAWHGLVTLTSSSTSCNNFPSAVNSFSRPLSRHVTNTRPSVTDSPLGFSPAVQSWTTPEPRASTRRIRQLESSATYRKHFDIIHNHTTYFASHLYKSGLLSSRGRNFWPRPHNIRPRPHAMLASFSRRLSSWLSCQVIQILTKLTGRRVVGGASKI